MAKNNKAECPPAVIIHSWSDDPEKIAERCVRGDGACLFVDDVKFYMRDPSGSATAEAVRVIRNCIARELRNLKIPKP